MLTDPECKPCTAVESNQRPREMADKNCLLKPKGYVLLSMPIRKSVSAADQRVARQSALKLFTDRNHERELLRHFFERLARVQGVHDVRSEKPILSIWGVGGIG